MADQPKKYAIETKDLYKMLFDTRNLEINLFWQRSNYFLVLNTGVAFGFFNSAKPQFAIVFAGLGLVASLLWLWVCLGSKYWQARWEHRLHEFEKEYLPGLDFFGADLKRIDNDARAGLSFHELSWFQKLVYKLALKKPSVSYSMIRLASLFVIGWACFLGVVIVQGKNPLG